MRERDEDSISRFPKMDNFNELGRNGIDSQYEEIVTDSHVAPEFDEYGGYAPPSIYGYDDETYVDADGRSEYQEGLRGQYAEDTKQDIYATSDVREQYCPQIFVMRTSIFHFQEQKTFTTDYFNYSDPIESKVCRLSNKD
jgi:hypothetical protein